MTDDPTRSWLSDPCWVGSATAGANPSTAREQPLLFVSARRDMPFRHTARRRTDVHPLALHRLTAWWGKSVCGSRQGTVKTNTFGWGVRVYHGGGYVRALMVLYIEPANVWRTSNCILGLFRLEKLLLTIELLFTRCTKTTGKLDFSVRCSRQMNRKGNWNHGSLRELKGRSSLRG